MVQTNEFATKKAVGPGIVLTSPEGEIMKYAVRLQLPATNNVAEYEALLIGLKLAKALRAKDVIVQADSQLVIGQVRGEYEAKGRKDGEIPKTRQISLALLHRHRVLANP